MVSEQALQEVQRKPLVLDPKTIFPGTSAQGLSLYDKMSPPGNNFTAWGLEKHKKAKKIEGPAKIHTS